MLVLCLREDWHQRVNEYSIIVMAKPLHNGSQVYADIGQVKRVRHHSLCYASGGRVAINNVQLVDQPVRSWVPSKLRHPLKDPTGERVVRHNHAWPRFPQLIIQDLLSQRGVSTAGITSDEDGRGIGQTSTQEFVETPEVPTILVGLSLWLIRQI